MGDDLLVENRGFLKAKQRPPSKTGKNTWSIRSICPISQVRTIYGVYLWDDASNLPKLEV
jgi:hypothetical protein